MIKSPFTKDIVFIHTGHIGDIIAFLPIYKKLGGTKLVIRDEKWMLPMSGYKYDSLKPLLESQGITVSLNESVPTVTYDMSGWRECYGNNISLMDSQARYVGIVDRHNGNLEINEPWLTVAPDPLTKGRVIFNRTHRYRTNNFPWGLVRNKFGSDAIFIGMQEEYHDFCNEFGFVEYYKTDNCLDVARAIQGSDLFIGNQSSAFWIAAGLRKPLVQETNLECPNSIVRYKGAHYVFDGKLDKL